jgi:hypothetical protein
MDVVNDVEDLCDLLDTCKKAGLISYQCVRGNPDSPKCSVAEMKIISFLSSINEKLERLVP